MVGQTEQTQPDQDHKSVEKPSFAERLDEFKIQLNTMVQEFARNNGMESDSAIELLFKPKDEEKEESFDIERRVELIVELMEAKKDLEAIEGKIQKISEEFYDQDLRGASTTNKVFCSDIENILMKKLPMKYKGVWYEYVVKKAKRFTMQEDWYDLKIMLFKNNKLVYQY